jgi:iron complex outermembrane receptor protein
VTGVQTCALPISLAADLHGFEASLDWRPRDDWHLAAAYSFAKLKISDDSLDLVEDLEGSLPRHILSLRSSHDLGDKLKLDFWLRRVGERDTTHVTSRRVPAYTSLDMRLAWSPKKDFELSLVGQNLLESAHQEYASDIFLTVPVVIERRGYVQARWQF